MSGSEVSSARGALLVELASARARVRELEQALGEEVHDDAGFAAVLFSELPDYVYFKDRERRFLRISDSFEALLGLPTAEIIGRRDEDLFPPHIAGETAEDDRRVIEDGIPLINKLEGGEVTPGVEHWVLTTKLPWRDGEGRARGLFGMSRDVTAQKRLEDGLRESERRLRAISDTLPFPVAATSVDDGTVLYANRAFAEFLDMPLESVLGARVPDYYVDPTERDALVQQVREKGRVDGVEIRLRRHDGVVCTAASSIVPLTIDGIPALMGAGADVTALKAREAELRELSARQKLLLREVNHRVRNNLATLGGLIREQIAAAEGPAREALRRIDRSVRGLVTVHRMLSDSGWRPLPLSALCRDVVRATLQEVEAGPRVRVSDTGLQVASQQAHQLALVMGELATNSLKHAHRDGPTEIEMSIEAADGGARITYRDVGPGFPAAVLRGDGRGMGLRLIDALVGYGLAGRVSHRNDGGAVTILDLPSLDSEHSLGEDGSSG